MHFLIIQQSVHQAHIRTSVYNIYIINSCDEQSRATRGFMYTHIINSLAITHCCAIKLINPNKDSGDSSSSSSFLFIVMKVPRADENIFGPLYYRLIKSKPREFRAFEAIY